MMINIIAYYILILLLSTLEQPEFSEIPVPVRVFI